MQTLASLLSVLIATLWMATSTHAAMERTEVHVLADPSVQIPLTRIARDYSRSHHVTVSISFAASDTQLEQLEQGAPADLMITLREDVIQTLKNKGLIDVYSTARLVKNRVCMATYADNPFQMILIPKLPLADILNGLNADFEFLMPDPATIDYGVQAMESLINHQLADKMEPHFRFIEAYADLARGIIRNHSYGIMLCTDASFNPDLKILGTFPETAHSPLTYHGMVIAGDNMKAARAFASYLTSPEALKHFTDRGFQALKADDNSDNDHLARGSMARSSNQPL